MTKTYYGIYHGIVTNIQDPEKRGRIKVKIPSVLGADVESAWCDPVIPVAYDGGGDFCLPQVNEAVWVQFLEGNVNRPLYLGGWWQKEQSPLDGSYDRLDDTRIVSYKDFKVTIHEGESTIEDDNKNIIKLDGNGIDITDANQNNIKLTSSGITLTDCNGNTVTMSGGGVTINSSGSVSVTAGGNVTVSGSRINLN